MGAAALSAQMLLSRGEKCLIILFASLRVQDGGLKFCPVAQIKRQAGSDQMLRRGGRTRNVFVCGGDDEHVHVHVQNQG